ncbi:MAG: tRNA glutamyl-Q(34) synthetase GluQRS [Pseudomonadota bacterium]
MITRFAPSPTGPLHLGHAYSALTVWQVAADMGGTALLRIEDTDSTRVRPEWEEGIYTDLAWLGLDWPKPVRRQSDHSDDYQAALDQLAAKGLLYPCNCTRRQVVEAGGIPGTDGMVYPGTCRNRPMADATPDDALRLDLEKAATFVTNPLPHSEIGEGAGGRAAVVATLIETTGDPVLRRKDTGDPAYHLACVVDDALQEVSHVVRGTDLQPLTPLHVLLQQLLDLPTPVYHHHGLITDANGKRLAKIDRSKALSKFRDEGATPDDIKRMINWPASGPSG